jgi:putative exporter of polyketide antibiotics
MPGGGYGYAAPQTNQKAIWALVTGILGIVCCGLLAGIPALILGNSAKKEIAASGGAQSGAGMAQAGFVLGIISVVLSVLYLLLLLAGVMALPSMDTSTSP